MRKFSLSKFEQKLVTRIKLIAMNGQNGNNLRNMAKGLIEAYGTLWFVNWLRQLRYYFKKINHVGQTILGKSFKNRVNLRRNRKETQRYLEIGPGNAMMPGFETLNIVGGPNVDYVFDAAKKLPFGDNTFDLIYASHMLEHIPWYKMEEVLKEWIRILKPGGNLEIWVPDGLKICKVLIDAEQGLITESPDDWNMFNPRKDPFIWVNGRLIYGARPDYPSWHRAIFSPRYLKELFEYVGLIKIKEMDHSEVRGYDHGWINLGVKGTKP